MHTKLHISFFPSLALHGPCYEHQVQAEWSYRAGKANKPSTRLWGQPKQNIYRSEILGFGNSIKFGTGVVDRLLFQCAKFGEFWTKVFKDVFKETEIANEHLLAPWEIYCWSSVKTNLLAPVNSCKSGQL